MPSYRSVLLSQHAVCCSISARSGSKAERESDQETSTEQPFDQIDGLAFGDMCIAEAGIAQT